MRKLVWRKEPLCLYFQFQTPVNWQQFHQLAETSHPTHCGHTFCHSGRYINIEKRNSQKHTLFFILLKYYISKPTKTLHSFCYAAAHYYVIILYPIMFWVLLTCAPIGFNYFVLDSLWLARGDKLEVVDGRCLASSQTVLQVIRSGNNNMMVHSQNMVHANPNFRY
mgnify:CR=1 FL=1